MAPIIPPYDSGTSNPDGWCYFYKVVRGKLVDLSTVRKWWDACPPAQKEHYARREVLRNSIENRSDKKRKVDQDRNLIGFGPFFDRHRLNLEHKAVLADPGGVGTVVVRGARRGVGRGAPVLDYSLQHFSPPSHAEMLAIVQRPSSMGWGPSFGGFGIWPYGMAPPFRTGSTPASDQVDVGQASSSSSSQPANWFTYENASIMQRRNMERPRKRQRKLQVDQTDPSTPPEGQSPFHVVEAPHTIAKRIDKPLEEDSSVDFVLKLKRPIRKTYEHFVLKLKRPIKKTYEHPFRQRARLLEIELAKVTGSHRLAPTGNLTFKHASPPNIKLRQNQSNHSEK